MMINRRRMITGPLFRGLSDSKVAMSGLAFYKKTRFRSAPFVGAGILRPFRRDRSAHQRQTRLPCRFNASSAAQADDQKPQEVERPFVAKSQRPDYPSTARESGIVSAANKSRAATSPDTAH